MREIFGLIFVYLLLGATSLLAADEVQFMSAEELKANLNAENISILDARSERGWSNSDVKIPGAIRATWIILMNGLFLCQRIIHWSSIAHERTKEAVPGWHAGSYQKVLAMSTFLKGAGENGESTIFR